MQGSVTLDDSTPHNSFLLPLHSNETQRISTGTCGCLGFVLKFTVNIFLQLSVSLCIGSRHLTALCWDAEEKTQGQFPPPGMRPKP